MGYSGTGMVNLRAGGFVRHPRHRLLPRPGRIHRLDRHRRLGSRRGHQRLEELRRPLGRAVCAERRLLGAGERSHPEHPQRCRRRRREQSEPRSTRCTAGCRSRSSCRSSPTSTTASTTRTLDFDLGFATLTSATSYNELEQPFRSDLTTQFSRGSSLPLLGPNELLQNQITKYDKVTQELRLASPSNDKFEWLLGVYYTKEQGDIIQHIDAVAPGTLNILPTPLLADATLISRIRRESGASPASRLTSPIPST